jgi:DNA-directed RNA polymerase specialized sigma24 family protein
MAQWSAVKSGEGIRRSDSLHSVGRLPNHFAQWAICPLSPRRSASSLVWSRAGRRIRGATQRKPISDKGLIWSRSGGLWDMTLLAGNECSGRTRINGPRSDGGRMSDNDIHEKLSWMFRRHSRWLDDLVRHVCSRARVSDPEDLGGDLRLTLWTVRSRVPNGCLQDDEEFRRYSTRVAINLAMNQRRRQSLRKTEELDEANHAADETNAPDDDRESRLRRAACVIRDRVSETNWVLINLVAEHGTTLAAEILAMPESTVRSRRDRMRLELMSSPQVMRELRALDIDLARVFPLSPGTRGGAPMTASAPLALRLLRGR